MGVEPEPELPRWWGSESGRMTPPPPQCLLSFLWDKGWGAGVAGQESGNQEQ